MAKYIELDALVAEIERRRNDYINSFMTEQVYMLNNVLDFIDTLEAKEVDLDAELEHYKAEQNIKYEEDINMFEFAKHFFELGVNASNPLTWEDIARINDITSEVVKECDDKILYDTQETFCKEVLKRFKAQKGE